MLAVGFVLGVSEATSLCTFHKFLLQLKLRFNKQDVSVDVPKLCDVGH